MLIVLLTVFTIFTITSSAKPAIKTYTHKNSSPPVKVGSICSEVADLLDHLEFERRLIQSESADAFTAAIRLWVDDGGLRDYLADRKNSHDVDDHSKELDAANIRSHILDKSYGSPLGECTECLDSGPFLGQEGKFKRMSQHHHEWCETLNRCRRPNHPTT